MSLCYIGAFFRGKRAWGTFDFSEAHWAAVDANSTILDEVIFSYSAERDPPVIAGPTILWRSANSGWSYGALLNAYRHSPNHDHYIFVEDDYLPSIKGFDRILLNACPKDGAAFQLMSTGGAPILGVHAALSNGIMSNAALAIAVEGVTDEDVGDAGQFRFAGNLVIGNVPCANLASSYRARSSDRGSPGSYVDHSSDTAPEMFVPAYKVLKMNEARFNRVIQKVKQVVPEVKKQGITGPWLMTECMDTMIHDLKITVDEAPEVEDLIREKAQMP